ncbi:MAG: GldG family protein [Bacteriovoracia bacterium]
MNRLANIAGIAALLTLCASLVAFIILPNELVVNGLWVSSLLLMLFWAVIQRRAIVSFLMNRRTRHGANLSLIVFLVLGILVFVNILAKDHSWRKDLTRGAKNSLSDQTIKVLDSLTQDVKVYYFTTIREKEKGEFVLKNLKHRSSRIQYEFVDSERRPTFTQSMGVNGNDIVLLELAGTKKQVRVTGASEEAVTNGLMKLLRTRDQTVYFIVGHGERSLDDSTPNGYSVLKGELEKQGYVAKELNLVSEGKIPADAALLVLAGPKTAFFPKELEILRAYLKAHGHLLLSAELDIMESGLAKGSKQVAELIKPFGLDLHGQMLVDPTNKNANVEPQILFGFANAREHPIVRAFPQSSVQSVLAVNFLFPLTTHITFREKEDEKFSPIVTTSGQAWAESDWESLKKGSVTFTQGTDFRGVMNLGVAAEEITVGTPTEEPAKTPRSRLVVFGASTFAQNTMIDKLGNRDLFLNSVAWLANDEKFISIRPKEDDDGLRQFSNSVINLILLVTVFFLPASIVICGVVVWWRRTKK